MSPCLYMSMSIPLNAYSRDRLWTHCDPEQDKAQSHRDMSDESRNFETRSSCDLWSEICSDLPEPPEQETTDEHFTDSFRPQCPVSNQGSFTSPSNLTSSSQWEPMADSAVYIASLENRLKRIKGQSNEVTSREMLRSLSQAKKECWDSALEQLKRWLSPERAAISAEELEYLLLPSNSRESPSHQPSSADCSTEEPDEEECSSPEK
ncbi:hypothetical protein Baya_8951 [Bagarius yarrelli]|uniref:Coiled-coil domain-containing protein 32 n=1 Tax=Bagarius yarrelli TaxID=175774 RepID=A0A556U7Q2_BAGYA|nr:hypothetical protein Baya_8951 [Bagarius yarrelli]